MSTGSHRAHARRSVGCALVTVSDTRTPETDASGARARELLLAAGHRIVSYAILPDEPELVGQHVRTLLADDTVEAVILNGGTGLAPRDGTYEAVAGLLDKRIDGFGELFRQLSYADVGPAAMLSRAVAGVAARTIVASLPGSTAAVALALEKLLVPELEHMVALVRG
ncbi:MAG: MogA/MoaB family molybdenum cofactor biosynthesis protein [bacterium]|nr:MogA/MoaB family molybdenum cofactor biosynthesis protein [bacterium]